MPSTTHCATDLVGPDTVIRFWFDETSPKQWFSQDDGFDALISTRFNTTLEHAKQAELYHWRITPAGRLAEIIVLDQFSRNIYRNSAKAFEADPLALVLAQEAVARQADIDLTPKQVPFLFMPYMHSESAAIHQVALALFNKDAAKANLAFELRHKAIIDRFGRYPHRNEVLGRESTPEERIFLAQAGSSF